MSHDYKGSWFESPLTLCTCLSLMCVHEFAHYMYSCMYVQHRGTEAHLSIEHHALMDVNVGRRRGVPRGREHGQ